MGMFDWLQPDTADPNLATTFSQTASNPLQQPSSVTPDTTVQAMRDTMPIVNSLPKPGERRSADSYRQSYRS